MEQSDVRHEQDDRNAQILGKSDFSSLSSTSPQRYGVFAWLSAFLSSAASSPA
jgi:hypothetical protein